MGAGAGGDLGCACAWGARFRPRRPGPAPSGSGGGAWPPAPLLPGTESLGLVMHVSTLRHLFFPYLPLSAASTLRLLSPPSPTPGLCPPSPPQVPVPLPLLHPESLSPSPTPILSLCPPSPPQAPDPFPLEGPGSGSPCTHGDRARCRWVLTSLSSPVLVGGTFWLLPDFTETLICLSRDCLSFPCALTPQGENLLSGSEGLCLRMGKSTPFPGCVADASPEVRFPPGPGVSHETFKGPVASPV